MSGNTRRLLLIIAAFVLLVLFLGSLWFFFFRGSPDAPVGGGDPFGNAGSGDVGTGSVPGVLDDSIDYTGSAGEVVADRLVRITSAPVSFGSAIIYIPPVPATTTANGTVVPEVPADVEVRFVERQSGNIYAYRAHGRTLTRTSNQTVPGVREAVWLADGSLAYLRFLSDSTGAERLETYALDANGNGGFYLEEGLTHVAATSSSAVLAVLPSTTGSVVTVASADGSSPRTAFSSDLTNFVASFFGQGYLAHTKGSASLDGYLFSINTAGAWTRLAGPLRGLAGVGNPSGSSVLYSYLNRGTLTTSLMDVASRTSVPLPIATLAEKCAFSPDGSAVYCAVPQGLPGVLPDDWYLGAVTFTDRIWKIDLASRVAILVVDPQEVGGVAIDAVSLAVDPTNDILTFTNRANGSLWAYDL